MEDGHRSWRWTATRYRVACVRLLDSRDIRASVCVFPTKSNAKIAIGWDELARSVSNKKKKFNMRRFRARLKKRRFDEKCGTKSTSVGTHAETHITKIKQAKCSYSAFSSVQFSSFLFSQNIIQYRNTYRNCKSLFKSFLGVREDWGLGWGAREVSWKGKKTPRTPQPNPQSSITPRKHLHSDWVRVCRRLMKPRLPSPKKNI